jgi:phosphoribosylformylglycinamidine (FGAM) synthase-like enzyme
VLMRATYRVFELLRRRGVAAACKDLGAGGLMGCAAELSSGGGYGAEIDLDRVNAAVTDLPPEVLAVGEAQERLLWALPPELVDDVLSIYNDEFSLPQIAFNARATDVGRLTTDPRFVLKARGGIVMDVDIAFLTAGVRDELPYVEAIRHEPGNRELPAVDVERVFPRVLAHRDVCSREPLFRRYDWVVRGATAIPRGAADAGVLVPIPGSKLGIALAVAGNPRYGRIDARYAAEAAVLEAVRRVVSVGARPIALTDCLNFGNPRKLEQYGELIAAIEGLDRAARELGLAFVSGNVSLYNESADGTAVPASPIVACLGAFDDVSCAVTPGLKMADSALLWIGSRELAVGGSVLAEILGIDGSLPEISYDAERAANGVVAAALSSGGLRSCRAVTDGGMLSALARLAFDARAAGRIVGAELDFGNPLCEAGGYLCEVADDAAIDVTGALKVGTTTGEPTLVVNGTAFDIGALEETWSAPLREVYP